MNQDTIAAISTGMTNSGIGIVRISGSEALEIADRVYKGKETITEVPTHTIHYGHVMDGDETVDEVLVMVMRGPRTFTGEDTVEINCHGGTYVVSRVLETVLKAGASNQIWSKTGRAGRIYQEGILKRQDGSVTGRGGH